MLFNALSGSLSLESAIINILACLVIIFLILPLHEWAHGFTANLLGDRTAKYSGRLTLNPISHIDLFGSVCLLLFGFGWAKPVPVNPNYFKHPKIGMAITAAAGPVSNLLAAIVGGILMNVITVFFPGAFYTAVIAQSGAIYYICLFLQYFVSINVMLAAFNLIPIPPLDGSKVLFVCLPTRITNVIYRYEQIFILAIYALLFMGVLSGPLSIIRNALYDAVMWVAGLPFLPFV